MTPASKLAQLSPDERIVRIRAEEARAERAESGEAEEATYWCGVAVEQRDRADRAESRLACWALSAFFGGDDIKRALGDVPCTCGHLRWSHRYGRQCSACACTAHVAWEPTAPTPDQRAAAAECGDVSGGRWRA